jgi:hypothetical protein
MSEKAITGSLNPLTIAKVLGPSTPLLDRIVRFLNTVRGTDKVLMVRHIPLLTFQLDCHGTSLALSIAFGFQFLIFLNYTIEYSILVKDYCLVFAKTWSSGSIS